MSQTIKIGSKVKLIYRGRVPGEDEEEDDYYYNDDAINPEDDGVIATVINYGEGYISVKFNRTGSRHFAYYYDLGPQDWEIVPPTPEELKVEVDKKISQLWKRNKYVIKSRRKAARMARSLRTEPGLSGIGGDQSGS